MMTDIQTLMDNYYKWLVDNTTYKQVTTGLEITTPFLDRHNDYIQIYLMQEQGYYIITDDGYTLEDLEESGYSEDYSPIQKFIEVTLNGLGISIHQNKLFVKTSYQNFAFNMHNFIHVTLIINNVNLEV